MTSPSPTAGALQIAAALVFHLPGARLEIASTSGMRCCVGPMTDPRCTMHPAEFRELVAAAGNLRMLGTMLGFAVENEPTLTLASTGCHMDDLGGGLYRVAGCETGSYAFATSLPACCIDAVLSELDTTTGDGLPRELAALYDDEATIGVNLVRDDGLGVTFVALNPGSAAPPLVEATAKSAVAACLVAEMEQLSNCMEGTG